MCYFLAELHNPVLIGEIEKIRNDSSCDKTSERVVPVMSHCSAKQNSERLRILNSIDFHSGEDMNNKTQFSIRKSTQYPDSEITFLDM
uniref:Uncharacterized protein n=1 Tax=Salmonella bongori TaxID=54736 RepID=F2Q8H1_SALBN|nr:hypothetical protein Sb1_0115 [Salmonella bongori]